MLHPRCRYSSAVASATLSLPHKLQAASPRDDAIGSSAEGTPTAELRLPVGDYLFDGLFSESDDSDWEEDMRREHLAAAAAVRLSLSFPPGRIRRLGCCVGVAAAGVGAFAGRFSWVEGHNGVWELVAAGLERQNSKRSG